MVQGSVRPEGEGSGDIEIKEILEGIPKGGNFSIDSNNSIGELDGLKGISNNGLGYWSSLQGATCPDEASRARPGRSV